MPNFIKIALCAFSAVLFVITLALAASNHATAKSSGLNPPTKTTNTQAGLVLAGCVVGLLVAVLGAVLSFLDDFWNMAVVKIVWTIAAMIALWLVAASVGIWADANDRSHDPDEFVGPDRWRTDMAFEIITCVIWAVTIAFVLAGPLEEGGNEAPKFPAIGICAVLIVFSIILMALSAADRAGHAGNIYQFGIIVGTWRTNALWTAFAIVGAILGILAGASGAALCFLDMWGKDNFMSRIIRFLWSLLLLSSFFFLAAIAGIWCQYQSNIPANASFSAFMKAEFSFEIIISAIEIGVVVVLVALGAGAGAKAS